MGLQIEFKKNLFLHLKVKGLEQGSETLTQMMWKNVFYTIAYDKKIYGLAKRRKHLIIACGSVKIISDWRREFQLKLVKVLAQEKQKGKMCQVFLRRKIIRNYYQATGNHVSISKIKSFTKGRKYFRRMLPPGWPQGLSLLATPAVAYHRLDPIAYGYQSGPGTNWSLHAPFGGPNLDLCPGTW